MAKNPHRPRAAKESSDDPGVASKVSFFDPNGNEIVGYNDETPRDAEPVQDTPPLVVAKPHAPIDDAPAVQERVINQTAATARGYADEIGETLHAKFMDILRERAALGESTLTAADIEEMGEEFRQELKSIERPFFEAVEAYAEAREKSRAKMSRNNLFQRFLVHKFEHAFTDERVAREHPEKLTRRMLPGFFTVLLLMFGKDRMQAYEREAANIVDEVRQKTDGPLDWNQVYNSPEVRKLCLKAEIEIAQHFVKCEKRLQWMIAIINSNLIPPEDETPERAWEFNEKAAETLMSALISDLRATLRKEEARKSLEARMGDAWVKFLSKIALRFSGP